MNIDNLSSELKQHLELGALYSYPEPPSNNLLTIYNLKDGVERFYYISYQGFIKWNLFDEVNQLSIEYNSNNDIQAAPYVNQFINTDIKNQYAENSLITQVQAVSLPYGQTEQFNLVFSISKGLHYFITFDYQPLIDTGLASKIFIRFNLNDDINQSYILYEIGCIHNNDQMIITCNNPADGYLYRIKRYDLF